MSKVKLFFVNLASFWKKITRKRKIWLLLIVFTGLFMWSGGFFVGWWWSHEHLGRFPDVDTNTRLLIVSPHPDDEVLMAGGLIQRVISKGGKVKIIYLTVGDKNVGSVVKIDKKVDLAPTEFLDLGERRHSEAISSTANLGLKKEDLVFLGFPDGGLREVLSRDSLDERGPVVSRSTKLDHVPYSWAYKPGQSFFEGELIGDLKSIVSDFKPTLVITTHDRDTHPDHRAAFEATEKAKTELGANWLLYLGLVHYKDYPVKANFQFPPKKLFNNNWASFELTDIERQEKLSAIKKYSSQITYVDHSWYERFAANNEVFELGE